MRISLDYSNQPIKDNTGKVITPAELTLDYLTNAVNQKYPTGLQGQLRRIWGRIQRKFDSAFESKAEEVELETSEKEFIVKSFRDVSFPANLARYVMILEDEVDKLSIPEPKEV